MLNNKIFRFVSLLPVMLAPGIAQAHNGVHESGFIMGLMHPLGGLDHLLLMVLVGAWATTLAKGHRQLLLPLSFLMTMGLGALIAIAGFGLPLIETVIAFSVFIMGLLLLTDVRPHQGIAIGLISVFALWHGNAHGLEAGADPMLVSYFAGFLVTTAILHTAGLYFGRVLHIHGWPIRALGLASGLVGIGLISGV